jgi:2-polyprenyl-3-methyl-5-hydroxy-6-metoxy-1,4-benzoquinol methylase
VDLVIATEVIEHLLNPQKAAREIYRVCKIGATVVGSVPSTSQIWSLRSHLSMTHGGGEPFHSSFTREGIATLWQEAGFNVDVSPCCMGLNWLWTLKK